MPNISITGDFRDNITPGLERVSRVAQQAQGPVRDLGDRLYDAGQQAEVFARQPGNLAASVARLQQFLRDVIPLAEAMQGQFRTLALDARRALGEVQQVFSASEGALHRFARTGGQLLKGFDEKFADTFAGRIPFAVQAGQKAFADLHTSLDAGLTSVFATAFEKGGSQTVKAWEKFTASLENTFYQSLGRMASALVQENLLAPLFKLGKEAAGGLLSAAASGLKALFLAEGGLVTKPTMALLGEPLPQAA